MSSTTNTLVHRPFIDGMARCGISEEECIDVSAFKKLGEIRPVGELQLGGGFVFWILPWASVERFITGIALKEPSIVQDLDGRLYHSCRRRSVRSASQVLFSVAWMSLEFQHLRYYGCHLA